MNIYEAPERTPELTAALLTDWEASVRATHHFLTEEEIVRIRGYVPQALQKVRHLIVAERAPGAPVGFLGVEGERIEMLFLAPEARGKGLGRALMQRAVRDYGAREVTVNEQNPQAVGFYRHLGFKLARRAPLDEAGDPYPILYLRLNSPI